MAVDPSQVIGSVKSPLQGKYASVTGLGFFLSNLIKVAFIAGGLFALINFLLAGFQFLSSQGDEKKVQDAWNKIYNSLIGLVVMAAAFIIISIISWLIFGRADWILNPQISGPTDL